MSSVAPMTSCVMGTRFLHLDGHRKNGRDRDWMKTGDVNHEHSAVTVLVILICPIIILLIYMYRYRLHAITIYVAITLVYPAATLMYVQFTFPEKWAPLEIFPNIQCRFRVLLVQQRAVAQQIRESILFLVLLTLVFVPAQAKYLRRFCILHRCTLCLGNS